MERAISLERRRLNHTDLTSAQLNSTSAHIRSDTHPDRLVNRQQVSAGTVVRDGERVKKKGLHGLKDTRGICETRS